MQKTEVSQPRFTNIVFLFWYLKMHIDAKIANNQHFTPPLCYTLLTQRRWTSFIEVSNLTTYAKKCVTLQSKKKHKSLK